MRARVFPETKSATIAFKGEPEQDRPAEIDVMIATAIGRCGLH
jgi:hypothetical protein